MFSYRNIDGIDCVFWGEQLVATGYSKEFTDALIALMNVAANTSFGVPPIRQAQVLEFRGKQ